jgi:hypothetical protein
MRPIIFLTLAGRGRGFFGSRGPEASKGEFSGIRESLRPFLRAQNTYNTALEADFAVVWQSTDGRPNHGACTHHGAFLLLRLAR